MAKRIPALTQELAMSDMRRGDVNHPMPDPFAPFPERGEEAVSLPTPLTSFVGRENAVRTVAAYLCREDVRLLTLTGPGGVGKTRLAIQAAAELAGDFADGVRFVDLAPIVDADLVLGAVAQELGIRPAGTDPVEQQLKSALRDKWLLL